MTGSRFDNAASFYAGSVLAEQTLTGSRMTNTNTFYGSSLAEPGEAPATAYSYTMGVF